MAATIFTSLSSTTKLARPNLFSFGHSTRLSGPPSTAYSRALLHTKSILLEAVEVDKEVNHSETILGCPVCYDPLTWTSHPAISLDSTPGAGLQCSTCKKRYVGREAYLDLTTSSGFKSYGDPMPASTELFRHAHFFPLFSSQSLAQLLKGVALSE